MGRKEKKKSEFKRLPVPLWFTTGTFVFLALPLWFLLHLESLWAYLAFIFFLFGGTHFLNSQFTPERYNWFPVFYSFLCIFLIFGVERIPGLNKLLQWKSLPFMSSKGVGISLICGVLIIAFGVYLLIEKRTSNRGFSS